MNALIESTSHYLQTLRVHRAVPRRLAQEPGRPGRGRWLVFPAAAGGGSDPALDLVSGAGQPALLAVARLGAALLAKAALVGLDRL